MIAIEHTLVSDEIVEEQFVCDLGKCKGGCCEDGDAGAPLQNDELDAIKTIFPIVLPYLTDEGKAEIERQGIYVFHNDYGWVTPTIGSGICAYGSRDANGIIKCGFEQAFNDGKTSWKKPISCHLYPIKVHTSRDGSYETLNYEPRESLCSPGCALGEQLKVPVYAFLKEPIIRRFGEAFYEELDIVAKDYFEAKKNSTK